MEEICTVKEKSGTTLPIFGKIISMTKFLLDSGDPDQYREVVQLAKKAGQELWSV